MPVVLALGCGIATVSDASLGNGIRVLRRIRGHSERHDDRYAALPRHWRSSRC